MNNSKNNSASLLELWDMTIEELNYIVEKNPSLRGMIFGYLAELKLEKLWLRHESVSLRDKPDDHDRRRKGDRLIVFKGKQFVFESKSLQTNSIARTDEGWVGKAQVDASDRRSVCLPDGTSLETTCLLRSEFDILAVNVFVFEKKWRFVFARNSDLPTSTYSRYNEYQRAHLLATLVTVHWPPRAPFRAEPFTLMNEMLP